MRNHHPQSRVIRNLCRTLGWPALAVGLAFVSGAAEAQQTYRMKFATQTLNDAQHEYIKVFKREIEKVTQGRIQVSIFPASQLGGAQRQSEGLRLGSIEGAVGPGELFVGADQRLRDWHSPACSMTWTSPAAKCTCRAFARRSPMLRHRRICCSSAM
jgi:hypothetical protein